ncbi:hypothetical protein Tco_0237728 [Tanacetum coccineum]
MLERYNHYITFRADKLPITKISYKINNATKDATMRIERNKQPLSLTFYEKFVLKKLGFSEWIEIHALASKVKSKSNDLLLKKLKAKFEWFKTQAEKLGIPSPSELTAFGLSAAKKKRKRSSEIIQEIKEVEYYFKNILAGMDIQLVNVEGITLGWRFFWYGQKVRLAEAGDRAGDQRCLKAYLVALHGDVKRGA